MMSYDARGFTSGKPSLTIEYFIELARWWMEDEVWDYPDLQHNTAHTQLHR